MNEPRADHIMQVGLGFWASKTLLSAVEMELFTELNKHPETLADLSARLGLHPRSAPSPDDMAAPDRLRPSCTFCRAHDIVARELSRA